jgi:MFS family permease
MIPLPVTLLRVFLPFAGGYFLSYLFRVVNAVIAPDLIADVGVGPSALGLLTASYFIAFASFQLPLGVLLDRYGPRRVEAALLLIAALGAAVFALADHLISLALGRALIGLGVSACLMAAFKAYSLWFPKEKWSLVNGLQMAAGGLGALAATSPVEALLAITDWRGVFLGLACLTMISAAMIFFVVPEPERRAAVGESVTNQLRGIGEIFTSRVFWRTAPLATASQASFMSIHGLWAGPWLTHVGGLARPEVAEVLFWLAATMVAGYIAFGKLAERLGRRPGGEAATGIFGMSVSILIQVLLLVLPSGSTLPLWLAFGFFGTSGVICYAVLAKAFPLHLNGRVTTALNLLVFVAAFAGQWAIGAIIATMVDPGNPPTPQSFAVGFGILIAVQVLSLTYYLFEDKIHSRRHAALRND